MADTTNNSRRTVIYLLFLKFLNNINSSLYSGQFYRNACGTLRHLYLVFLVSWFFFLFWFVVAYCTQLLSQAMYNLMMATMAETI